jgi:hypothetical protein
MGMGRERSCSQKLVLPWLHSKVPASGINQLTVFHYRNLRHAPIY